MKVQSVLGTCGGSVLRSPTSFEIHRSHYPYQHGFVQGNEPGISMPFWDVDGSFLCPFVFPGSLGFCGGRGPEGPPDVLVHPEIRQGEPPASVSGTFTVLTLRHPDFLDTGKFCR